MLEYKLEHSLEALGVELQREDGVEVEGTRDLFECSAALVLLGYVGCVLH
jgi:hypothetical protein